MRKNDRETFLNTEFPKSSFTADKQNQVIEVVNLLLFYLICQIYPEAMQRDICMSRRGVLQNAISSGAGGMVGRRRLAARVELTGLYFSVVSLGKNRVSTKSQPSNKAYSHRVGGFQFASRRPGVRSFGETT